MADFQSANDIGHVEPNVFVPVYVDVSGQYRRVPSDGILDIAGTFSSNFSVGGKAIMLADGTSSDGNSSLDLQTAYIHSIPTDGIAKISLSPGKDFAICDAVGNPFIKVDSVTGKITIAGEMSVISSIVKFLGSYQEFDHLNVLSNDGLKPSLLIEPKAGVSFVVDPVRVRTNNSGPVDFSINNQGQTYIRDLIVDNIDGIDFDSIVAHLSAIQSPNKHFGSEILYEPTYTDSSIVLFAGSVSVSEAVDSIIDKFTLKIKSIESSIETILAGEVSELGLIARVNDLETQVASINSTLSTIHSASVIGIDFQQQVNQSVWTIHHNTGSNLIQFTVYDQDNRILIPDDAFPLDINTFVIVFGNGQLGRAVLACLVPPVTVITNVTEQPLPPPLLPQ